MNPGVFRLILAFVVVVHHSFPLRMGAWAVGMFFMLSGYWISRMWRQSYSRKTKPYRTFLISRWWRISPLFVAVQLLAAFLVLSRSNGSNPSAIADWRWWVTQLTVFGSTHFGRLLPPSWSLDVEMQFYLVAPIILMIATRLVVSCQSSGEESWQSSVGSLQNESVEGLAGVQTDGPSPPAPLPEVGARGANIKGSLAISAMLVVAILGLMGWSIWRLEHGATLETPRLDVFLWLFVVGVACELVDWRPSNMTAAISGGLLFAVVGLAYANRMTRQFVWVHGADASADAAWGASVFFVLCTLVALPLAIHTVHQPSPKWDRWLGDLSYPLYLFHWIPRDWYYANVDWSLGSLRNGGLLMANFAMAFAGAVLLLQLVDRPLQRWRQGWVRTQ